MAVMIDKADQFDRAVHGDDAVPAIASYADLVVITKNDAMESGGAAAVITWTVDIDGKRRRAQYTVSIRHLQALATIIQARYDANGFPRSAT